MTGLLAAATSDAAHATTDPAWWAAIALVALVPLVMVVLLAYEALGTWAAGALGGDAS